jgi:hypothetical protein
MICYGENTNKKVSVYTFTTNYIRTLEMFEGSTPETSKN